MWLVTGLAAILLSHSSVAQNREAATPLGTLPLGGVAVLELDQIFPLSRLMVEIDGDEVLEPLSLDRDLLLVPIPERLRGTRHELVLFRRLPGTEVAIARWTFQTNAEGDVDFSSTINIDAGVRAPEGGASSKFARVGGAMDFDVGQGRFTGELNFFFDHNRRGDGEDELLLDSYFLQFREQLDNADLLFKIGTHILENDTNIMDERSRRGVSLTVTDPTETQTGRVFALQATSATDENNLSGLADSNDLIIGAEGTFYPIAGSLFKLSVATQDGRAPVGPNGLQGEGTASGIAISGELAESPFRYELIARTSEWTDAIGRQSGDAYSGELIYSALSAEDPRALEISFRYFRIAQGYFSALDPDAISGLQGSEVGLTWYGPTLQWSLTATSAKTNVDGPETRERDRLRAIEFDAVYDPGVFTGGFLLGTTFGFSAAYAMQDRIDTPFSGAAPLDHREIAFQLSIDQDRARYSWGLAYTFDRYDDRTLVDFDEEIHGFNAIYAYTPYDELTAIALARAEYIDAFDAVTESYEMALSLDYEFVPDRWSVILEAGMLEVSGPIGEDGKFARAELAYEFFPENEIFVGALYGSGSSQLAFNPSDGWAVVAGIRTEFDIFSTYRRWGQ